MKSEKFINSKFKASLLGLLILLIIISLGTGAFFYKYLGKFNKNYDGKAVEKDVSLPTNVLFLGMDIGDPKQKDNDSIKRTDTIMLVHLVPKEKKAYIVSIPRDMMIKIKNSSQKINAAFSIGGDSAIKQAVEDIMDVPVDYLVKLNYEGFRSFVDAIGGVEMTIDRNMYYDDAAQNLHINFKKGQTVLLDGKKAEEFFRWRKNNDGTGLVNGDLDRIDNQHKFIEKVVEKCTSVAIIPKLGKILDVLPQYIETDIPPKTLLALGKEGMSLKKENVKMYTLKGVPRTIDNISYLIYDKEANSDIIGLISGQKVTESNGGVPKSSLKIKILNATKVQGLASKCMKDLEAKGYKDIEIGNAKEANKSEVQLSNQNLKNTISNDININKFSTLGKNDENFDIIIILGKDYKN
ncbi:LCP family protein [Clostridium fungisolvens]|uniref:Polyisoprenyl-teichoic acid--peptidoglycan teichoic acid transferase TagU n=1 Tax=Clostridium fungisolvens TaxID=1604897 RepID=A0A6V8SKG0_9CLOT|nr:LCP family protein [Clostridium fungisolvens]GFP77251.1 Polyisoprenyl-teichoic acid--peptidoglycan teichoic acid transferase TagU [Clostridium fungisolvens]